ncbi:MAG: hypothetical protein ACFFD4_00215 [Candidatus Odinarchaeota archaeon]
MRSPTTAYQFCSFCRNNVAVEETFVCTDCRLVVCPNCYAKKFSAHSDQPRCVCGSTDVLNFGGLKNSLINELIDLRNRMKESSYKPVVLYLKFLKLMDEINVLSHDFYTDVVPDAEKIRESLLSTEKFITYYLEDYSTAIKRLQNVLLGLNLQKSGSYPEISFQISFFADQMAVFGKKIEDRLLSFISEYKRLEEEYKRCTTECNLLKTRLKALKKHLRFGELPVRVFRNVKVKKNWWKRKTCFIFTTGRLLIVQRRRFMPWRRLKVLYDLAPEDLVDSDTVDLRFGREKLIVKSLVGDIIIVTRNFTLLDNLKHQMWKQISGSYKKISLRNSVNRSYLAAWDVDTFKKRVEKLLTLKIDVHTREKAGKDNVFLNSIFKKIEATNTIYNSQLKEKQGELENVTAALEELQRNYQRHLVSPKDYYELYSMYRRRVQKLNEEMEQLTRATNQAWI